MVVRVTHAQAEAIVQLLNGAKVLQDVQLGKAAR
jgi:hypothetical protein